MSKEQSQFPGIAEAMMSMARRDLLLAWKRPGDVLNPLFFFAMAATLFPLAVGPSAEQLQFSGPGVLWVSALLAMLLSVNSLFISDYEDGSLEQMLVSPVPLPALALGKAIAHWLTSGLPLALVAPLVAVTFQMPLGIIDVLLLSLLLGTLSLSLLGAIGAALTVGLHRGTALLSLLVLPLAMPVLIFGARSVALAADGEIAAGGLYFLAAYGVLILTLAPFAIAAALRISNE